SVYDWMDRKGRPAGAAVGEPVVKKSGEPALHEGRTYRRPNASGHDLEDPKRRAVILPRRLGGCRPLPVFPWERPLHAEPRPAGHLKEPVAREARSKAPPP